MVSLIELFTFPSCKRKKRRRRTQIYFQAPAFRGPSLNKSREFFSWNRNLDSIPNWFWSSLSEHYDAPKDASRAKTSVACRSFLLKEGSVRISYYDHEVLGREEVFTKDDIGKELLLLESASISTVKSLQTEMMKSKNSYESSSPHF